jgi:glycosyltransferase involved in cell wall biosynthesis
MTKVSVLMSVYNGEKYLEEAISSVLNQSERELEFVIVNDGSTDGTDRIVRSFSDTRIKYLNLPHAGRVPALNAGLKSCQGEYIAILDADDVCLPDRLKAELNFIERHDLALCGAWAKVIDENGKEVGEMTYPPIGMKAIRRYSLLHNPFIHSTVMMKRELIEKARGYRKARGMVEDYELWTRIIYKNRIDNIPQVLIKYREHSTQATKKMNLSMRLNAFKVRSLALFRFVASR